MTIKLLSEEELYKIIQDGVYGTHMTGVIGAVNRLRELSEEIAKAQERERLIAVLNSITEFPPIKRMTIDGFVYLRKIDIEQLFNSHK